MNIRYRPLATAALLIPWIAASSAGALTDTEKCEADKLLASSKFAQCRLKADSTFAKSGDVAKRDAAYAKCSLSLSKSFQIIETKYGIACPSTGDAQDIEAHLTQCSEDVSAASGGGSLPACGDDLVNVAGEQCDGGDLAGATCESLGFNLGGTLGCDAGCDYETTGCRSRTFPATGQTTCWNTAGTVIPCAGTGHDGEIRAGSYFAHVDNEDGTISDLNTGLMWEKLSDDGTLHDKDNKYTWSDAFAVKLAALNAGSGLAGHTDWRLPNVKELQTLVDYELGFPGPAVAPAFNTLCFSGCLAESNCSCTASELYWTSTSSATYLGSAWYVNFSDGGVVGIDKTEPRAVRAVRGGS